MKSTSSAKQVTVAVVGLGFMGVTHIRAYRKVKNVRLAAVCDAVRLPVNGRITNYGGNIGKSEPLELNMRQVKAYKDFEELLANPEIDLIDICVPTPAHPPLAIAALKAGKHVLCEKPLARTVTLAKEIVAAANSAPGYFMPAMCMRFWPEWAWLKQVIADKTFGAVLAARFRRIAEPPAWGQASYFKGDQSGGALFDLHIHDTDFVQFCFGKPRSVFASGHSRFSGAIDHVVTQYEVAAGVPVHAEGSWLMTKGGGFSMSYTVHFEKATADFDLARGKKPLRVFEEGKRPRTVVCPGADGYVQELQHMIDAIRAGHAPAIVTAQDGLAAVEICEAEEKSVYSKRSVSLS